MHSELYRMGGSFGLYLLLLYSLLFCYLFGGIYEVMCFNRLLLAV